MKKTVQMFDFGWVVNRNLWLFFFSKNSLNFYGSSKSDKVQTAYEHNYFAYSLLLIYVIWDRSIISVKMKNYSFEGQIVEMNNNRKASNSFFSFQMC